ncbi:hypothetical protein ADK76_23145 [Streptomyces griseoflavus]|uniref:hypothetical protein n=1 Tax=Streptomyces rimosus TaxID=1927 RepID=UPI0004C52E3B|nr:hypothetical protein [Streptomyces rimosus]KOG54556.1 hypothetical protein ADK76_23145 [Streptomyces griseoflavus]
MRIVQRIAAAGTTVMLALAGGVVLAPDAHATWEACAGYLSERGHCSDVITSICTDTATGKITRARCHSALVAQKVSSAYARVACTYAVEKD